MATVVGGHPEERLLSERLFLSSVIQAHIINRFSAWSSPFNVIVLVTEANVLHHEDQARWDDSEDCGDNENDFHCIGAEQAEKRRQLESTGGYSHNITHYA